MAIEGLYIRYVGEDNVQVGVPQSLSKGKEPTLKEDYGHAVHPPFRKLTAWSIRTLSALRSSQEHCFTNMHWDVCYTAAVT